MTRVSTAMLLAVSMTAGCQSPAAGPDGEPGTASSAAVAPPTPVKDIPAIDRQHYPDNLGYLYEGQVSTILWMQNRPTLTGIDNLASELRQTVRNGLIGDTVATTMQHIAPIIGQPTMTDLAIRTVQSTRMLSQYAFTAQDYGEALSTALGVYNADPVRQQTIADTAARIDATLRGTPLVTPGGAIPRPPPPAAQAVIKPGQYFSDAVRDGAQAFLRTSTQALARAIQRRDVEAYGAAFTDVSYCQLDLALRDAAHAALAVAHADGVLQGQPLDKLVAQLVIQAPAATPELSMEQLRLINQINLLANDTTVSEVALVAALLVFAEDRRQGEADDQLTGFAIWSHVRDSQWLISQYVRVKADGTTEQDVRTMIDNLIASLSAG